MSIDVVNGYVCTSCSDVSLAKKGVDPAHPQDNPASPTYNAAVAKADKAKAGQAVQPSVTFGGQLAALNASNSVTDTNGVSSTTGVNTAAQTYRSGALANFTV
jgi:hypothetical protein